MFQLDAVLDEGTVLVEFKEGVGMPAARELIRGLPGTEIVMACQFNSPRYVGLSLQTQTPTDVLPMLVELAEVSALYSQRTGVIAVPDAYVPLRR